MLVSAAQAKFNMKLN